MFCSGDHFKVLVDRYLRQGLHKGVPPLFVDLRSLYKDPEKVEIIQRLLLQYVDALQRTGHFSIEGKLNLLTNFSHGNQCIYLVLRK
jgi:peptide alpha-N-acetyltransferase